MIDEEHILHAKAEADKFAPLAAECEADYRDLLRSDAIIFSRCLLRHKNEEETVEMAKARARTDPEYTEHIQRVNEAHRRYLKAEKAFNAITVWIRLATSYLYKEGARLKAGV